MISIWAELTIATQKVCGVSRSAWGAASTKALVCGFSLLTALPVQAADYDLQKIKYDVYAGGIHAVKADMTLDYRQNGRYAMVFGAETRGLLGSLAPWAGTFESKGWVLDGRKLTPQIHESVAMWRDEKEVKTYRYDQEKGFVDITTTYVGKKPKTRIPEAELTKDTTDALTATMMVMEHVSDGGKCEGESEVYDGKRRYKLIYKHLGFVKLEKTRYNAYSGPAAECTVEVKPVAGRWHKKPRGWLSIQEQGRDRGTMPTVWMAQVVPNAVVVPVRVRVKTAYGTLFMHMTHYESGKTVLKPLD
jgi:hypothetical protein